jgi:aryl-alcohol dehydrogenase-like predicted oxidoreductase
VSFAIIDKTAEDRVDVFDTADDYRMGGMLETICATETIVAKWLKGGATKLFRATKCWVTDGRRCK